MERVGEFPCGGGATWPSPVFMDSSETKQVWVVPRNMSTNTKKKSKKDQSTAPTSAENACKAIDLVAKTTDAKPPLSNTEILRATAKAIAEENTKKVHGLLKWQKQLAEAIYQFKVDAAISKFRSLTDEDLTLAIRKDDSVHLEDNFYRLKCEVAEIIGNEALYSRPNFPVPISEKDQSAIKTLADEYREIEKEIFQIQCHKVPHGNRGETLEYDLCNFDHVFAVLKRNQQTAKAEATDRSDKILADPELRDALLKAGHKLISFTPSNHKAIEA